MIPKILVNAIQTPQRKKKKSKKSVKHKKPKSRNFFFFQLVPKFRNVIDSQYKKLKKLKLNNDILIKNTFLIYLF